MSVPGPFRWLSQLRSMPRDLFAKLDFMLSLLRSTDASVTKLRLGMQELTKDLQELDLHRELIAQLAALQDELVRRAIADRAPPPQAVDADKSISAQLAELSTRLTTLERALTESRHELHFGSAAADVSKPGRAAIEWAPVASDQ